MPKSVVYKPDFIATAAQQVRNGAPVGARVRGELAQLLTRAASSVPTEPVRHYAMHIAVALESDRKSAADFPAWSRLKELHALALTEAATVAEQLRETLRTMYPAAYALELEEDDSDGYMTKRLVSAQGHTVRDLRQGDAPLPELPESVRGRWPKDALQRVTDLDDIVRMLGYAGLGFEDLPAATRETDECQYKFIPALFLHEEDCELGCC